MPKETVLFMLRLENLDVTFVLDMGHSTFITKSSQFCTVTELVGQPTP
jgi:hypothetical protein